jgi:hypothetical protein
MSKPNHKKGKKAWLVTWEWASESAKRPEKVAAILNPRWSPERVREYVEFLYATEYYTLGERMKWALRKGWNPYPATFGQSPDHHTWRGEIACGHHPFLFGRLVDDLTIECNTDGKEIAIWTERKKPWELKIGFWREASP